MESKGLQVFIKVAMAKKEPVKSDHLLNRTPPHDIDAEASLLSAIFINNDSLFDIIEILNPDDFYKGAHKKIFRAITELSRKEEPADLVTVANHLNEKDELEGGWRTCFSCCDFRCRTGGGQCRALCQDHP